MSPCRSDLRRQGDTCVDGATHPPRVLALKASQLRMILVAVAVTVCQTVLRRRGLLPGGATGAWPFYVRKPLSQPEHIVLAQVQGRVCSESSEAPTSASGAATTTD